MEKTVLIIDDDRDLSQLLKDCLAKEQIRARQAFSGPEGLRMLKQSGYHAVVLDIMLPGLNGFEVLTELRKSSTVPVLMLTAKDTEADKVSGLRMGADDYLTKPFSLQECIARIQALIRRHTVFDASSDTEATEEILTFSGLSIDLGRRLVRLNGQEIELTRREFDVLALLASHPGRVYTKKQIYDAVWAEEYAYGDANLMSYMSKLRKKIHPGSDEPEFIETVWGVGYRFRREE